MLQQAFICQPNRRQHLPPPVCMQRLVRKLPKEITMRIDNLRLKNYRCFDSLSLKLHPQMTVLVAPNGHGKTSILDAVKVALWPYVAGFDLGSTTNDVTTIQIDDVFLERVQTEQKSSSMEWRLPAQVNADGTLCVAQLLQEGVFQIPQLERKYLEEPDPKATFSEGLPWQITRFRESVRKGTKTKEINPVGVLGINDTAQALQQRIFTDRPGVPDDLPVLGYYGTGRLWAQKKLTSVHVETDPQSQSRTFAYRDCLDPFSSYKHFAVWFTRVHQAYLQAQIRNLERHLPLNAENAVELSAPFKAVQNAIDKILRKHTGWGELAYNAEHEELVLHHDTHGVLKVSQLSDGIRSMLALVGDIAYRCYKLNNHLGMDAPTLTRGIVMIDEVDMHLHPSWQQTVLSDLSAAFPKLQFIVTTHSPQVLTSIASENIRILYRNRLNQWEALPPEQEIKGVESAVALNDIMRVNPIPPIDEANWLVEYTNKIENHTYDDAEGRQLRAKLIELYGERHPVILDTDRLIRFQAFKLRKSNASKV
ncbi:AAA family ATPase [Duganella sp. FT80W]|uniref:AAA family ATPase n=2 Tax=Duganella guangzhouensis TaxID=2666084 RepID=A0A6I2LCG2_9BURK|nr:AAA family ATPase [Duganella guangzhouensis]